MSSETNYICQTEEIQEGKTTAKCIFEQFSNISHQINSDAKIFFVGMNSPEGSEINVKDIIKKIKDNDSQDNSYKVKYLGELNSSATENSLNNTLKEMKDYNLYFLTLVSNDNKYYISEPFSYKYENKDNEIKTKKETPRKSQKYERFNFDNFVLR